MEPTETRTPIMEPELIDNTTALEPIEVFEVLKKPRAQKIKRNKPKERKIKDIEPKERKIKNIEPKDKKPSSKVPINDYIKKTSTGKQNLILQKKNIVFNVYTFFKTLSAKPEKIRKLNFNQAQRLTAEACGMSLASVKRITRMYCTSEKPDSFEDENILVLEDNDGIENIECDD